jgi:hypothetical protein
MFLRRFVLVFLAHASEKVVPRMRKKNPRPEKRKRFGVKMKALREE